MVDLVPIYGIITVDANRENPIIKLSLESKYSYLGMYNAQDGTIRLKLPMYYTERELKHIAEEVVKSFQSLVVQKALEEQYPDDEDELETVFDYNSNSKLSDLIRDALVQLEDDIETTRMELEIPESNLDSIVNAFINNIPIAFRDDIALRTGTQVVMLYGDYITVAIFAHGDDATLFDRVTIEYGVGGALVEIYREDEYGSNQSA